MIRTFLPSISRSTVKVVTVVVLASQSATSAFALNPKAEAQKQADRISQAAAQQARDQQQEKLRALNSAPRGKAVAAPKSASSPAGDTCIQVNTIDVTGAKIIAEKKIAQATASFEGKCLGLTQLNNVLQAVTFLYVKRGYVASRAFLPEQDLSKGVLSIKVVEGQLEDVVLKGGKGVPSQLKTAFPGLKGKPVNLRDVEQGLDQINRLTSNKATIALEPGQEQGDTVLGVTIDKGKPWNLRIGSDNLGSLSTGLYQSRFILGLDSPLGLNDQWNFTYQRSMSHSPYSFSSARPSSDTVSGSFSIPYGYWTAGIDTSWSQYHSSVHGQVSSINTSGGSLSISPYVSLLLTRDKTSKTWLTGRLTWRNNDNFILGSRIDVSSRILTIASVELGHSRQLLGGSLTANLGYEFGLPVLGAVDDATAPAGSAKGQFKKITGSLGYSRSQNIGPVTAIYSGSLSGQWSNDPLFASEQMALGGTSTVRGSRGALLSASDAFYVRNELSLLLPAPQDSALAKTIGRVEPYIGLDFGHSIANVVDGSIGGNIAGATIGVRNRGARLNFDVSWSRILSVWGTSENIQTPSGLVQAKMSVSF